MVARKCGNRGGCHDVDRRAHRRREATAKHGLHLFRPVRQSLPPTFRVYLVLAVLATFALGVVAGKRPSGAEIGLGRNWKNFEADTRTDPNAEQLVRRATLHHTTAPSADLPSSTSSTMTRMSTSTSTSTSTSISRHTNIITTTTTAIPTEIKTDVVRPTSLPVPFDSISLTPLNMTTNCAEFLAYVLSDPNFQGCLPLSGLLRVGHPLDVLLMLSSQLTLIGFPRFL